MNLNVKFKVKSLVKNNSKVLSNYYYMTILQFLNSFFYLLIYPFVLKKIGLEYYGLYVFYSSLIMMISVFVSFGFELHGLRTVSDNDKNDDSVIFCNIFYGKLFLLAISAIVFFFISLYEEFQKDTLLMLACFVNIISVVFYQQWFFQGKQIMKALTLLQLILKVISLPVILICIENSEDVLLYALIMSLTNVISSFLSFIYLILKYKVKFIKPEISKIRDLILTVKHFFWSNAANAFKHRSVELIIGLNYGMTSVAIYDIALKIYQVPSLFATNINNALFPKLMKNYSLDRIKNVFILIGIISLVSVLFLILFSGLIVELLNVGANNDIRILSSIMSINIFSFLFAGAFIYFVFIPNNRYDLVSKNQAVSCLVFFVFSSLTLLTGLSYVFIIVSLVLAGLFEVLYCYLCYKKIRSLSSIQSKLGV